MKTLIISLAFFLISGIAIGQQMVIGLEVEYTATGVQAGNSILYESQKLWAVGAFYQSGIRTIDDRSERSRFYGTQMQFPLIKSDRLSLLGSLRTGLVMDNYFVVVPGLETRVNLGKHFGVAFTMSPRQGYPALAAKVLVKLF